MLRALCVALGLGLSSSAVYASDCETLRRDVDTAMRTANLTDMVKAKVDMLRARGEEEHKAGNKLSCLVALEEALELLNS